MVSELHVWGPAFSLASIDPHCLAAIVYLTQAIPRNEWELVASNDDSLSPTKALPALRDGPRWIGSFSNIIDHLNERIGRDSSLDPDNLSSSVKADITAFSAFIETHGQALLDLNLYVSSENYTECTRPAYSRLLQWPGQWFVTPQKRDRATARTENFGLSSLDLDAMSEEHKKPAVPSGSDSIPQILRMPRPTVTGLIERRQHAARFRLDALADAFFEPLQDLLRDKRYMLSEEKLTTLDCLAFSYLALMLIPQVPHKWLADAMKGKYPGLCAYVERLRSEICGGPVQIEDALIDIDKTQGAATSAERLKSEKLPWRKPADKGARDAGSSLFTGIINSLPLAGDKILLESTNTDAQSFAPSSSSPLSSIVAPSVLALGSLAAAVGGYLLYSDVLSQPIREKKNLSEMGAAGAILDMGLFGNATAPAENVREGRVPVGLEVDVAVDEAVVR